LKHVKIAVAVPGIKRLHWYSDNEIALSGAANAFSTRRMAGALSLMQGVRHVISESALVEKPLFVHCAAWRREDQKQKER
jgi:hypothetical protein